MIRQARAALQGHVRRRALRPASPRVPHPRLLTLNGDALGRPGWAWALELSSALLAGCRVGSLSGPPLPRPCRIQRLAQQQ